MARILVTGMSGTGKTTILEELARRGYHTVDTAYGDWVPPNGLRDAPSMKALLSENWSVVISGTVENQGGFYAAFEHVALLTAPLKVLSDRLRSRVNNHMGKQTLRKTR